MDAQRKIKTYPSPIEKLELDEVFVFGANLDGFHGAGSAGFASFGVHGNVWRSYDYGSKQAGWKGRWAVKGMLGLQEGTHGKSYALVTVTRPGARRSYRPSFKDLFQCCRQHSAWKFYLAQSGSTGLNGWTPSEMAGFISEAGNIPENLYFSHDFVKYVENS
jgi:hypothetical protein